jgi:hypothetical protein
VAAIARITIDTRITVAAALILLLSRAPVAARAFFTFPDVIALLPAPQPSD